METIATKDNLSFDKYYAQLGTITIELIKLGRQTNGLFRERVDFLCHYLI